jgi:hypothetical protein
MSSGSGTSFNQSYTTIEEGILPLPYPSNIEGDIGNFEKGIGAISTNYQPNLSSIKFTQGGKKCKNNSKCKFGSKKQKRNLHINKTIRHSRNSRHSRHTRDKRPKSVK